MKTKINYGVLIFMVCMMTILSVNAVQNTNITCSIVNGSNFCTVDNTYDNNMYFLGVLFLVWLIAIVLCLFVHPLIGIGSWFMSILIIYYGNLYMGSIYPGLILFFLGIMALVFSAFKRSRGR